MNSRVDKYKNLCYILNEREKRYLVFYADAKLFEGKPLGRERRHKEMTISFAKVRMTELIQEQPDDATFEEILRELAFERMVERGLKDSQEGRFVSNDEMGHRIKTWQK